MNTTAKNKQSLSIVRYLRLVNFPLTSLFPPAALSCLTAILNLGLLRLMFPLIHGIITWNFESTLQVPLLGSLLTQFHGTENSQGFLLIVLAMAIACLTIAKCISNYLSSRVMQRQAAVVSARLRSVCFSRALQFGKLYFDRGNIARLNASIMQSARWIHAQFASLQGLTSELLLLAGYLLAMTIASWRLTVAAMVIVPITHLFSRGIVRKIRVASKNYEQVTQNLHAKVLQVLFGLTLIQGSGQTDKELAQLNKIGDEEVNCYRETQDLKALIVPVQEVSGTVIQLMIACTLAYLASFSTMNSANLVVFFFLASRSIPLTTSLFRYYATLAEYSGGMSQVEELLSDDLKFSVAGGEAQFDGMKQGLTFKNLSFAYDENIHILKSISCDFPANSINGLFGPTGSGKSTIAMLLMRLYDCPSGSILLDGRDIRDFSINSLRSRIAYVGQEPIVFEDSLRANVIYGLDEPPSDTILTELFKKCRLDNLLERFPSGFDTVVGERGARLSGGEKQRIAVLRALLRPADIVILDEPTSAIDNDTEKALLVVIRELTEGKTVLLISHKTTTLSVADQAISLNDGMVTGRHVARVSPASKPLLERAV